MQINVANPDMRMTMVSVAPPANIPLDLADVKNHLRVTGSDDDEYILGLIDVAVAKIDGNYGWLGRALITQTWDCFIDWNFPYDICPIEIPLAPLQSVSFIKYYDPDGNQQTVDASVYTVDIYSDRSRILTAYNQYWPAVRFIPNVIQIRGVFGFGLAPGNIPAPIRHAMLLMIGHLYENREETTTLVLNDLPKGIDALLLPYRIRRF